ncbi:MAG: hypothetical protein LAQ30_18635, partial [Acidobacteriia bacterium]|nr:hypothetical protein [Terriglobia bacterium]
FSGDPSKKFDVTFGIDMRALLSGLGMKPAQVEEIMKTAAENAKKNLVSFAPSMGGRGGRGGGGDMAPPGMPPGMDMDALRAAAAAGGQQPGAGFGRGQGASGGRGSRQGGEAAAGDRGQRQGEGGGQQATESRGGQGRSGRGQGQQENGGRRAENGQAQGQGQAQAEKAASAASDSAADPP